MNEGSGPSPGQPEDELRLNEEFIRAAAFMEGKPGRGLRPSRESMREVKREARQRRRARARAASGKPPRRRSRGRDAALLGIAVAVVAVPVAVRFVVQGLSSSTASRQIPVVVPSSTPSAAVTPTPSPTPTRLADPYAGTEVGGWPVGDSGIVAPAAKAVGGFTAAQVAAAYRHTKAYLHEALLDPTVVFRGALAPVEATISNASLHALQRNPPGNKDWPTYLANRFLPQQVTPGSFPFRVNGFMTASRASNGQLQISFHYVVVYDVLSRHALPGSAPTLVGIRRDGFIDFDVTRDPSAATAWLALSYYTSDRSDCTRTWPDPGYLEVYLQTPDDPTAPVTSPMAVASLPAYPVLDPRATDAPTQSGCFNDTTSLGGPGG